MDTELIGRIIFILIIAVPVISLGAGMFTEILDGWRKKRQGWTDEQIRQDAKKRMLEMEQRRKDRNHQ